MERMRDLSQREGSSRAQWAGTVVLPLSSCETGKLRRLYPFKRKE